LREILWSARGITCGRGRNWLTLLVSFPVFIIFYLYIGPFQSANASAADDTGKYGFPENNIVADTIQQNQDRFTL
jgi:hypothetical protein